MHQRIVQMRCFYRIRRRTGTRESVIVPAPYMTAAVALIPLFEPSNVPRTLVMLFVTQPILLISIAGVVLPVVQRPYWILNCAPVVWSGKISYSLYLWQQPFCSDPHLRSGYLVILAFVCAALSYYFVEQPLLRMLERRSGLRKWQSSPRMVDSTATAA